MAWSNKPSVSTRRWRFLPLIFLPASKPCGSIQGPFFSALDTLAIDDGSGGAGFAFASLTALHIKRVMNAIERAVVAPQVEIVVHRAAWRQVFRDRPPLASRAQNIHYPIHHFALVDVALVAAAPSRRDQRQAPIH